MNKEEIFLRRLADEDDELSEVQPDAVPPEVREWLASTFTRQLATTRRKADEKPKFRSVAHAIRAGIFVDRIYRRVTSTAMMQFPQEVVKVLKVDCLLHSSSLAIARRSLSARRRLYRPAYKRCGCSPRRSAVRGARGPLQSRRSGRHRLRSLVIIGARQQQRAEISITRRFLRSLDIRFIEVRLCRYY